jgi:hypothetical protein
MQQLGKEVEEEMINQNIPKLTSEGVNEKSVEDVLQSHGESLTIDEL